MTCLINPPVGWETVFTWAQPELNQIANNLCSNGGWPWYPYPQNVFRAFDLCPLNSVKVVIIGQDPYHSTDPQTGQPQAMGLAFATPRGAKVQPSLVNIYRELSQEYPQYQIPNHGDLSFWADQGVLLLNTSLTVTPGQAGSHRGLWLPFIQKILYSIGQTHPNCIYLLWGKDAQEVPLYGNPIRLIASHPSPLSVNRVTSRSPAFNGCNHFVLANSYLVQQGHSPIDWQIPT